MLTKKRMAIMTVFMTIAYFFLLLLLPKSIVGERAEHMLIFASKLVFLSITAAITTSFILVIIFKRDFIKWQVSSLNRFKYLLQMMVKRDFVSRYRKSVLGVFWSLLNPLLTMLVMTMVFSYLFRFQIENYPIYILSGQIMFNFFSESTNQAMNSIIAAEAVIKKVYVPKYIYPFTRILSSLVNMGFAFAAFILVFIFTRAPFQWTMLLLPIPIIYIFIFSLGIGLILSSLAVFFRDLMYLYGIGLTLLTYLTPLFYPIEIIPERFRSLMGLNPMYQFVDYFRSLALHGTIPGVWTNMVCIAWGMMAVSIGAFLLATKQDKFILYL